MNNDLTYKNENIKNFKKIMSHFATGVCVLTSIDENSNYEKLNFTGITINSFNSVSLNPQLILYSLAKNGSNFDKLLNSKNFFINILSENQKDISNLFAFQKDFSNFKDFEIKNLGSNNQKFITINGSLGGIACEKYIDYDGGDHQIILGKVIETYFEDNEKNIDEKKPLIYFGSKYRFLKEIS